jgi:hypothetical protein
MTVTRSSLPGRDQFSQEVDKIISSHILHGSESLCRLLQYLAKHAIEHPNSPLKEYQIATEVFGRRIDFDPQSDSTIRVQAGRLRLKLAEYYSSEGAEDPIIVELPKGTYILSFHHRGAAPLKTVPHRDVPESTTTPRFWITAAAVLAVLLIISIVAIGMLLTSRKPVPTAHAGIYEPPAEAFQSFWKPFVTDAEEPWVIFSNAAFVGRPETGMRYYTSGRDPQSAIWDHYTGVGEVLAIHTLDQIFGLFRRHLRVKRGSLFSLDDAKNNDLIFIGSPSENLTLGEIPTTQSFVFQRVANGPRKGDLAIVNTHPQPGETREFLASPSSPLIEDYAVIGFVPGLAPEHSVLILAGTTTFGTQAAAEFVSRQNSVEDLLARLTGSKTGTVVPFEAVVHVKVARGVPVESELVALRKR